MNLSSSLPILCWSRQNIFPRIDVQHRTWPRAWTGAQATCHKIMVTVLPIISVLVCPCWIEVSKTRARHMIHRHGIPYTTGQLFLGGTASDSVANLSCKPVPMWWIPACWHGGKACALSSIGLLLVPPPRCGPCHGLKMSPLSHHCLLQQVDPTTAFCFHTNQELLPNAIVIRSDRFGLLTAVWVTLKPYTNSSFAHVAVP